MLNTPKMFDRIAARYDLLNRLLSFRRDVAWRKLMARAIGDGENLRVLDVATGTGDVLLTVLRQCPRVSLAVGLDPSGNMLLVGGGKLDAQHTPAATGLVQGDASDLPIPDEAFHAVTCAFGIRNMPDMARALSEMGRVLRPGGRLVILEFSTPSNPFMRLPYLLYFRHVLPRVGAFISGDRQAYRYLNRSAEAFPMGHAFCEMMSGAGLREARFTALTFGAVCLYEAVK